MDVYNGNGNQITAGLQEHEARRIAQKIANEHGESVWLDDGDPEHQDWDDMERFDPEDVTVELSDAEALDLETHGRYLASGGVV